MNFERYMELVEESDREMKRTNGHTYMHVMKTRCMYCGRSPNQKGKCRAWIQTFVNILGNKIIEPR